MALNVFISGVSNEFRSKREEIARHLAKFRNLDLYPTIQESLTEASTITGALVDKLIANVRGCRLVICLVGHDAGYPLKVEERLQVQKLAEERLKTLFRKDDEDLGDMWRKWRDKNLGMTYTQLEFFLAASVFANDTRVRVAIPIEELETAEDRRKADETNQVKYLQFLRQAEFFLDWVDIRSVWEESVTLAVEFALQQRDARLGVSESIEVREALQRSLLVLESLSMRERLTNDAYDAFYRNVVWQRLADSIVVLRRQSTRFALGSAATSVYCIGDPDGLTSILRLKSGLWSLRYSLEQLLIESRHYAITDAELIYGASTDGRVVLTHAPNRGWLLYTDPKKQPLVYPGVPDQFARSLCIVGESTDAPWFAVPCGDRWSRIDFPRETGSQPIESINWQPSNEERSLQVLPLGISPVVLKDKDKDKCTATIPGVVLGSQINNELWIFLPDSESTHLKYFERTSLMDLFLVAQSDSLEGNLLSYQCYQRDNKDWIAIELSLGHEKTETHNLLIGPSVGPNIEFENAPRFCDHQIQLPETRPSANSYPFPLRGSYAWSKDQVHLLFAEKRVVDRVDQTRIWFFCFPRPIDPGIARLWLSQIESRLSATVETPISLT